MPLTAFLANSYWVEQKISKDFDFLTEKFRQPHQIDHNITNLFYILLHLTTPGLDHSSTPFVQR